MTQKPTQNEVITLIDRAKSHDLGIDFLTNGALDAVAMTFGVHAFVVDAARDKLAKPTVTVEHKETVTA
ncbi:MAG: hypothetical protein HOC27_07475 [Phycisphaerae bacterium]|jgi:hypothetical protein|nr:hypothetical protein [Phycisphaerae bacterium]